MSYTELSVEERATIQVGHQALVVGFIQTH